MAEYFSHDYDTRSDEKIMALMADLGWIGYGLFWGLVELLYQNNGYMRSHYNRIAFTLRTDEETIKKVIEEYDLFQFDEDGFYSNSINERIKQRLDKSAKARESALKRWGDANAKRTQSECNAIKERKVKESKVNKINIPFTDFWNLYDKKVDRKASEAKWIKLTDEDRSAIMEAIPAYKESQPDKNFRKDPKTYFNNRSWENEIISKDQSKKPPNGLILNKFKHG